MALTLPTNEMVRVFRGKNIADIVAETMNRSARTIQLWIAAYQAFPTEDLRAPTLHFYHHGLAAFTKGPAHWLAEAFERKAMK